MNRVVATATKHAALVGAGSAQPALTTKGLEALLEMPKEKGGHHVMTRSQLPRWLVTAVSVLTLGAGLAACGTASDPTLGHLVGVVYIRGATIEDTPIEALLKATPIGGDTSHAYSVNTASDGTFSVDLPKGRYELTGTLTRRNAGGRTSPQEVTIEAGQITRLDLYTFQP